MRCGGGRDEAAAVSQSTSSQATERADLFLISGRGFSMAEVWHFTQQGHFGKLGKSDGLQLSCIFLRPLFSLFMNESRAGRLPPSLHPTHLVFRAASAERTEEKNMNSYSARARTFLVHLLNEQSLCGHISAYSLTHQVYLVLATTLSDTAQRGHLGICTPNYWPFVF